MELPRYHLLLFWAATGIYFVTAVNSMGYYQPDEHYQLIEFANLKLGVNSQEDLAWEYKAEIRPAFQPLICFLVFKALNFIGVTDPYHLSLALRLLTACLSLLVINLLVRTFLPIVKTEYKKFHITISYLLWFLPFLSSRFSSETWSALMVAPAVAILFCNRYYERGFMAAGLLLGAAFLFRYQSAIMITGILCWLVFIRKEKATNTLMLVLPIGLMCLAGLFIDTWFYGHPVLSSWNYFLINIIHDAASAFGTMNAKDYLLWIILSTIYPIGIMLLITLVMASYSYRKSIVIWTILPFIMVHFLLPHKELRFLFPVALFIPLIFTLAWQKIPPGSNYARYVFMPILILAGLLNIAGLTVNMLKDAGNGRQTITHYLAKKYGKHKYTVLYGPNANPYRPWAFLDEHFYLQPNITELSYLDYSHQQVEALVVMRSDAETSHYQSIIKELHMHLQMQPIPSWIIRMKNWCYLNSYNDYLLLYTK